MILSRPLVTLRLVLFLLFTATLIGTEISITNTDAFSRHPVRLSLAVVFDLVFVTTAAFYWILARPLRLAWNRLLIIALLMIRVAFFIVPQSLFNTSQIWAGLLALAEGVIGLVAGLRIRRIVRAYRRLRGTVDAETALQASLAAAFEERLADFMAGEVTVLYYALFGWRLRSDLPAHAQPVTTHRQSGQIALTVALLVVILIEGLGIHLLLARWHATVAVGVSALSAYGMLFFVADIMATLKRPSYLTPDHLNLRLGIRWRIRIERSLLADVSLISEKPVKQAGRLNGSFLTAPNVLLSCTEPVCVAGPYGIRKSVRQLAFFVDDRSAFLQALQAD